MSVITKLIVMVFWFVLGSACLITGAAFIAGWQGALAAFGLWALIASSMELTSLIVKIEFARQSG